MYNNEIDLCNITSDDVLHIVALLKSLPALENELKSIDGFICHLKFLDCQYKSITNSKDGVSLDLEKLRTRLPSIVFKQWKIFTSRLISLRDQFGFLNGIIHLCIHQLVESYIISNTYNFLYESLTQSFQSTDKQFSLYIKSYCHFSQSDFGIKPEFQCPQFDAVSVLNKISSTKTPMEKMSLLYQTCEAVEKSIDKNLRTVFALSDGSIECATDDLIFILLYVVAQCTQCHDFLVPSLRFIQEYHFVNSSTSSIDFAFCHFQIVVDWYKKRFILFQKDLLKNRFTSDDNILESLASTIEKHSQGDHSEPIIRPAAVTEPTCTTLLASQINRVWLESYPQSVCIITEAVDLSNTLQYQPSDKINTAGFEGRSSTVIGTGPDACEQGIDSIRSNRRINNFYVSSFAASKSSTTGNIVCHRIPHDSSWKKVAVSSLTAGPGYFGFATSEGDVYTWGLPDSGRLGMRAGIECDSFQVISMPRRLDLGVEARVVWLSCGKSHVAAVTADGRVVTWGDNRYGQLGTSAANCLSLASAPTVVDALQTVFIVEAACGAYHTLARTRDGSVYSWGRASDGRLGQHPESVYMHDENLIGSPSPVQCSWSRDPCERGQGVHPFVGVPLKVGSVVTIAAGYCHSLAVTSDGIVFSWGRGTNGRLGHGGHCHEYLPKQVLSLFLAGVVVTSVSAGLAHSLMLDENGFVYGCGDNAGGQLANLAPIAIDEYDYKLNRKSVLAPVPIGLYSLADGPGVRAYAGPPPTVDGLMASRDLRRDVLRARSVSCGASHSAVVTVDGAVLIWPGTSGPGVVEPSAGSSSWSDIVTLDSRITGELNLVCSGGDNVLVLTKSES